MLVSDSINSGNEPSHPARTYAKLSPRARALLYQMKDELRVGDDNSLWTLLCAHDSLHRLYDETPSQITMRSAELGAALQFIPDRLRALKADVGQELAKSAIEAASLSTKNALEVHKAELEQFLQLMKTHAFKRRLYTALRQEILNTATTVIDQSTKTSQALLHEKSQEHIQHLGAFVMTKTKKRLAIGLGCMLLVMISLLILDGLSWRGLIKTLATDTTASGYSQREAAFYARLDHKSRDYFKHENARLSPEARLNFPHP